mmetsp:Transcript_4043/g.8648  ORF Transcript_4043/g.8648 Transcript_4043/m.8648 type:complete len:142 (+) Transcript_4043:115-540(+)
MDPQGILKSLHVLSIIHGVLQLTTTPEQHYAYTSIGMVLKSGQQSNCQTEKSKDAKVDPKTASVGELQKLIVCWETLQEASLQPTLRVVCKGACLKKTSLTLTDMQERLPQHSCTHDLLVWPTPGRSSVRLSVYLGCFLWG